MGVIEKERHNVGHFWQEWRQLGQAIAIKHLHARSRLPNATSAVLHEVASAAIIAKRTREDAKKAHASQAILWEKRAACLTVGVCMHNAASQMRCVIMLHFSGAFASAPPHSSASQGRVNCPGLRSCHLKGAQMFAAPTCIGRTCFYSCDNLAAQYFHSSAAEAGFHPGPRKLPVRGVWAAATEA